jgi:hypothetical protein
MQTVFVSPDWELQRGQHHRSLCSNDVVRSTASTPAIPNSVRRQVRRQDNERWVTLYEKPACLKVHNPSEETDEVIHVNDQIDTLFQCIYFTPLHVSSNKCSSSGGSNCVNTSSGIIHCTGWLSCVPVSTQDSHPLEYIIPDDVLTQFDPPDDEHLLLETCRGVKQIHWKGASSWSLTRITSKCTVNKI